MHFGLTDNVRKYFGETIAFFFAYFGFYTWHLIPPAVFGIVCHLVASQDYKEYARIAFCIFNLIWVTVFLEMWKVGTPVPPLLYFPPYPYLDLTTSLPAP